MDPLDDVFAAMRVADALYARLEATAPWGLSTRQVDGTARFGLMLRGGCWLTLDDDPQRAPVALAAGDCFVIPHGRPYTLRDASDSPTVNCVDVVRANLGGVVRVGPADGNGAVTTLVSGWFQFDPEAARPLMEWLPPLLHIRMDRDRTSLMQAALQLLAMETAQRSLGSGLVASRLADIIFVQAVRAHVESLDGERDTGWLAALSDRRIGAALHLLHANVAARLTVESLASAAGMSRSGFALRFKEKLGQAPLDYLTRWRMYRAGQLLRHTDKPLVEIAESVGYESEAAFNKAFRRTTGTAPGAYRRGAQATATAPAA